MTVRVLDGQTGRILGAEAVGVYAQELLGKLGAPDHYVEIHVLPTRDEMRGALERELESTALSSSFAVPDFATYHEAFAGYPRVWLSSIEIDLGDPVCRARLQHEIGHAVLHWEISSYAVAEPAALAQLTERGIVDGAEASIISYLLLVGIKDYDVSVLLEASGIRDDQIVFYLQEMRRPAQKPLRMVEVLGEVKILLAAHPFRGDDRIRREMEEVLHRLGHYGELARSLLARITQEKSTQLEDRLESSVLELSRFLGTTR